MLESAPPARLASTSWADSGAGRLTPRWQVAHVTWTAGVGRAGIVSSRRLISSTNPQHLAGDEFCAFLVNREIEPLERHPLLADVAELAPNTQAGRDIAHRADDLHYRSVVRKDFRVDERVGRPFPRGLAGEVAGQGDQREPDEGRSHSETS